MQITFGLLFLFNLLILVFLIFIFWIIFHFRGVVKTLKNSAIAGYLVYFILFCLYWNYLASHDAQGGLIWIFPIVLIIPILAII